VSAICVCASLSLAICVCVLSCVGGGYLEYLLSARAHM